jgi:hypothetical protein
VEGGACLALKEFRVNFSNVGRSIVVTSLATGYRPAQLATLTDSALEAHRALAGFTKS